MKNHGKVLLMLPGALDRIESRAVVDENAAQSLLSGAPIKFNRENYLRMVNDTAVISISGPLINTLSYFDVLMGYNSYAWILEDIKRAVQDNSVNQIVLDFDSPGGAASEMFELAHYIKSLGAEKPIYGWIGSMACSAAYGLASACKKLYANPAAEIGSVGTMMVAAHQESPDDQGNRYIQIVASASPLKNADPTTPEGIQTHMARLDALNNQFIELLAINRGVTADFVRSTFGQGAVFSGREAVDRKMIDGTFATFDEFLLSIKQPKGKNMPETKATEPADVTALNNEPTSPAPKTAPEDPNAPGQPVAAVDSIDSIRTQVLQDERARVAALSDLAVAGGVSAEILATAIADGISPDAFSKDLIAAKETKVAINTRSLTPGGEMSYSERIKAKHQKH